MLESSASAGVAVRACSRHAEYRGDHFCINCAGPLCRACAKTRQHKECDACRSARGEGPAEAGANLYAAFYFDALRQSWPLLVKRLLPATMVLTALSLVFGLGPVFAAADVSESLDETLPGYAWLFLTIHVLVATSLLAAPLPRKVQDHWVGSAARAVLCGTFGYALFLVAGVAGLSIGNGVLYAVLFTGLLSLAPAVVAPYSALVAHHRLSPAEAARRLVRAGWVPLLGGLLAGFFIVTGMFSVLYPLFLVSAVAAALVHSLGTFLLLVSTVVSLVGFGWFISVTGAAGARLVLDRTR